jgi:hypothetical protein
MADTPSAILLLRLQSVGSNTNLWGSYLNVALQTLERASKGYQALAVTGDATITWSNYAATNTGAVAFLKLTGALTAAATLTFPNYQNFVGGVNQTGQTLTIKCSGGTGVAIPNGVYFLLYCDGTDYANAAPTIFPAGLTVAGQITGVSAGTANSHAVNLQQMAAAIAASVPAGTAGTIFVNVADALRGYIADKITVAGSLSLAVVDLGGGNLALQITNTYAPDEGQTALIAGVYAL